MMKGVKTTGSTVADLLVAIGRSPDDDTATRLSSALESARLRYDIASTMIARPGPMRKRLAAVLNQARRLKAALGEQNIASRLSGPFPVFEGHAGDPAPSWEGMVAGLQLLIDAASAEAKQLENHAAMQIANPMGTLVGVDLPSVANEILGIGDNFSRGAEGPPYGEIISFAQLALQVVGLPDLTAETIGSYIAQGRGVSG